MRFLMILLFPIAANAAKPTVALKDGGGKEKVTMHCQTCHSLDYIEMNAGFLGEKGWTAELKKMIEVYGAPVPDADVAVLVKYLSTNY